MLKSGGSILDANPGSDLDAIQQRTVLVTVTSTKNQKAARDPL